MKRAGLLLLAALAAAPAAAQGEVINDHIILTDESLECQVDYAAFLTHVQIMVILVCQSYPFIQGFELGLACEGLVNSAILPAFPVPAAWEDPSPADWDSLDFIVEYATPLLVAPYVILATLDLFYLDTQPIYIRMIASDPSRVDGQSPAYLADPGRVMVPLLPIHYVGEDWDFAINDGDCGVFVARQAQECGPLPEERMSWGAVKSLYR